MADLKDRGFLREGAAADVVVYDLENLKLLPSEVVHDLPGGDWRRIQRAEGYRWVLVNGDLTFEDGEPTGALSGKLLPPRRRLGPFDLPFGYDQEEPRINTGLLLFYIGETKLKQSGIYMEGVIRTSQGWPGEGLHPCLQGGFDTVA